MLRFFAFHFSHHDDQRKKLLARNRHQATRAIGARLAGQHRRRRSRRGFLRTFRCAHARETRRERRRVRIGNIWLGRQFAQHVAGLAHAAQRAGACLYAHTRVAAIEQETNNGARKFRVQTSKGATTARELILASGAYTTEATTALRKKIIPIGSYIIATEVLPAGLARELSPRNRMIYDSKHFLYYYRLTPDHRMLFGGRAAFFPETETTEIGRASCRERGKISVVAVSLKK